MPRTAVMGKSFGVGPIRVRQGAYLPHWTRENATYAFRFRLADSLPESAVRKMIEERKRLELRILKDSVPMPDEERKRLIHLQSEKIEKLLDAGHGECWLRNKGVEKIVVDSLHHADGAEYHLIVYSVMPNHVHVVAQVIAGNEPSDIVGTWKSVTAHRANKLLGREGDFWQKEPYDHLVRDEADLTHCIEYTLSNKGRTWHRRLDDASER